MQFVRERRAWARNDPQQNRKENIMNKFKRLACSIAASLLLASGPASADKEDNWSDSGNSIQGAWQVETTVRLPADDCTTAPLVPPFAPNPFPSFNTFHQGGTMNEHGSRSSPAYRSPGFGVWERIGQRRYAYRLIFHSFDENGLLSATMNIRTDLNLAKDGQTFVGTSRFVRTDISGNALNFCATMTAERILL
jgi:hypothetical protein